MSDHLFDSIITSQDILDLLAKHLPRDTGVSIFGAKVFVDDSLPKNKIFLASNGKVVEVINLNNC